MSYFRKLTKINFTFTHVLYNKITSMCSCLWYVDLLFQILRLAWNRLRCADPESAETKLDPRVSGISKLATKRLDNLQHFLLMRQTF